MPVEIRVEDEAGRHGIIAIRPDPARSGEAVTVESVTRRYGSLLVQRSRARGKPGELRLRASAPASPGASLRFHLRTPWRYEPHLFTIAAASGEP